jgi:hypothetical protein
MEITDEQRLDFLLDCDLKVELLLPEDCYRVIVNFNGKIVSEGKTGWR